MSFSMKSAYELAMERLDDSDPQKPLSDAQKRALEEIDRVYNAKIAEKEIFLQQKLTEAPDAVSKEAIETQLINTRSLLEEERESEKEIIRKQK